MLKASDLSVLEGKKSFRYSAQTWSRKQLFTSLTDVLREAFVEQMHSIDGTLEECAEYQRKYADLDIGFAEFYRWARASAIPVVVLSAGLQPLIRALIARLLGPEAAAEIEIISNEVVAWEDTKGTTRRDWQVKLHDGTEFGMDKSVHIEAYKNKLLCMPDAERPILLFAGDGVSDLSAAKSADLLFAKAGKDLITYCKREEIPFVTFEDWRNILEVTKRI